MALPILDGNQTAATLSTVLTSGEHIPAHTVVSLGSQAITDVRSAVSGSVVSISNFPASQSTTFGAVTGNVSVLNFPSTQTVAGTVTANLSESIIEPVDSTNATQVIAVHIKDADGNTWGAENIFPVVASGTVTIGNSVTIGSLPAISGTVTANNSTLDSAVYFVTGADVNTIRTVIYSGGDFGSDQGAPVDGLNPLPITGCVNSTPLPISGTVTANVGIASEADVTQFGEWIANGFTAAQPTIAVIGTSGGQPFPISGTVTAAAPNGSLTTRFGTPTTANVSFATSAVTNDNRKYLLIQNVTTGSNVITVGIGFTPTTTQGIQLTAGAGITFESSYIPTGAVYVLSSVTASNFTILEA